MTNYSYHYHRELESKQKGFSPLHFIKSLLLICFGVAFCVAGMAMMAAGLYLAMAGIHSVAFILVGAGSIITFGTTLLVEEYI